MSGARYYFKMGACTEVGVGPYSPVKDVYTPPKKYGVYVYVRGGKSTKILYSSKSTITLLKFYLSTSKSTSLKIYSSKSKK